MKKVIAFLLLACSFPAFAQKTFDSAAYVQFQEARWENWTTLSAHRNAPGQPLSATDRVAGLSKCWAEAKYNFANFDLVPRLNWDSLYSAFLPAVLPEQSTYDYYRTLQRFYSHLHDGHTGINLPVGLFSQINAVLPVEIRYVEGKALIVENRSMRPEDRRIVPGTELVAFNDTALDRYVATQISPYLSFSTPQDSIERIYRTQLILGTAGRSARLTLRGADGRSWTQELAYVPQERFWERLPLLQWRVLPGNVGYLQVNSFGDNGIVRQFDSLYPQIAATKSLIIDLRNNGGGNGSNGFELIGYLTKQTFLEGAAALRAYKPVGRSWGGPEGLSVQKDEWRPYKGKLYERPVVVLTSAATYSAAEDFTSAFRTLRRGTIIGMPTGGSTGQPVFFNIPGGGSGRICAKRDFMADGTEFVGIGIQPDVRVEPTIKGVRAGKDEVLEAALRYLGSR